MASQNSNLPKNMTVTQTQILEQLEHQIAVELAPKIAHTK
jgi:hypothetical protein